MEMQRYSTNASSTFPPHFFFSLSFTFSNLHWICSPAAFDAPLLLLFDCHKHLALKPGFAPQYARKHTTPPLHAYNQLTLHTGFIEITEACRKRQGARANRFINVPVPQLSNISITCHTGNALGSPAVKVRLCEKWHAS